MASVNTCIPSLGKKPQISKVIPMMMDMPKAMKHGMINSGKKAMKKMKQVYNVSR